MSTLDLKSGEEYQSIYENAIEGIFQSSLDGRFIKVNPAMAHIYGYDSPEEMFQTIKDIGEQIYVDSRDRDDFLKPLQETGHIEKYEGRNCRKDGSIIWIQTNARIVRDDDGNALFIEGFITDITSRKEAELALRASEKKYRALVERLPGVVFLDAPDDANKVLYVSSKIEDVLGYTPDEWIAEVTWSDSIHPDDRKRILTENKRTDKTGEAFCQDYRLLHKSGEYIWVREEAALVRDEKGKPLFWQGFLIDISNRKQAEFALQQSEEQFKKIFQANPIASCIATFNEGRFIAANDAYWKLTGSKPHEILEHTSIELGFITPKKRQSLQKKLKRNKSIQNKDGRLITKSGEFRDTLEFYNLVSFNGQECILSMFYDITGQARAQQALLENEEKYRQLFEAESDAIFLFDIKNGNILEANSAASALYGYSRTELLKKKNTDLLAEYEVSHQKELRNSSNNLKKVIYIPLRYHRKKNGDVFPVEITGRFFEWRGRNVLISAIRDITERKKVEDALQASEERFRLAFHTSPDSININRMEDGLYVDVNEGFITVTGYTRDDVIGKTSLEIDIWANQEDRNRLLEGLKSKGFVDNLEAKFRMKDGRLVTALMSARVITLNDVPHIISITRDVESLKRAEETMQRQLKELTILHNVATAASSSKNADELIQRTTDIINDTLFPDNCGVELVTNQDTYQAHPSYRGATKKEIRLPMPLSKGVTGKVISTGKSIRLGNVSQEPSYVEVTSGVQSELCVPITIQDRVIGVINVESKAQNAFNETDERLLNTIAGTLATSIEQLRLLETSQRQLQELSIINAVAMAGTSATTVDELIENITQIIGESLYPDNFGVLLLDKAGIALIPHPSYRGITTGKFPTGVPLGQGISGQVAASGKSVRIANVRTHKNYIEVTSQIRSELCVPIRHGEQITGIINAESVKINAFTEDDERLLMTISSTLATAIEKLRLFDEEKKRRQDAEILREATTALTTYLNLQTLLDTVLEKLSQIVSYDSASIALDQKGMLSIVAGRGFPDGYRVIGKSLKRSGKWGRLENNRRAIIISDLQVDPDFEMWDGSDFIHGWMGVPMFVYDKIIGYINLDSRQVNAFSERDALLAQTFANSAAVAIENARLFETEKQNRQKAETLREATAALTNTIELETFYETVLDSLAKLVPYDSASIEILDHGQLEIVAGRWPYKKQSCIKERYPYHPEKWGGLENLGEPIIIPNVQVDDRFEKLKGTEYIRGWLGIPMIAHSDLVGFINLDSRTENFYTAEHAALAQTFGNQAAIAIENARLFAKEQLQRQNNATLLELMRIASSSLELEDVMQIILERLSELVPSPSGTIQLLEDDHLKIAATMGLASSIFPVGSLLPIKKYPLNKKAIKTKLPVYVADTVKNKEYVRIPNMGSFHSFLCVPLIYKENVIGLITLDSEEKTYFKEQDVELTLAIARHAAIAIENARLFTEEQEQRQRNAALLDLMRVAASSLDPDKVLQAILSYTVQLIPSDSGSIQLLEKDTLRVATEFGLKSANISPGVIFPVERFPINEEIIREKHPLRLANIATEKRFTPVPGAEKIQSFLGVPLSIKDKVIGVINLDSYAPNNFTESDTVLALAIANHAAFAIENARLFEAEQRRHRESETLRQAALAITTSLELESVLDTILIVMKQVVPYDSASVLLVEGDNLKVTSVQGFPDPKEILNWSFPASDQLFQDIKNSEEPIIIKNVQEDPRFKKWVNTDYVRGWMGVSLLLRNEVIGCITFDSRQEDIYNETLANLTQAFANQAASAIQNARQFESEQRHFQEAETLRQAAESITSTLDIQQVLASILDSLNHVVPLESASVFLLENDMVRLTAHKGITNDASGQLFSASNGLFQAIWQSRLPLILNDAQQDSRFKNWVVSNVRGWMGVPLIVRGIIIGYITIDSNLAHAYNEHDATLAMTFAHQAAAAIENARLYERSEQQIRQFTVLRDIDSAISSSFDLRVILNLLIGHTKQELNADAVAILLYNSDLQALTHFASVGLTIKNNTRLSYLRIGEGLAGQVVLQRKFIHIPHLNESPVYKNSLYIKEGDFKTYFGIPLIGKGQIKGVLEIYTYDDRVPSSDWLNFLHTMAGQAAIAIDNVQLFKNLQRSNMELTLAYDTTLEGWGRALELRDKETQGHTDRVVDLTERLARYMGIKGEALTHIRRGTLLHDIGKMGIPDHILHKPGPLTDEEWQLMRQHPQFAYDLINPIPYLRPALDIPYAHHERWDGSGYPRGLKGEDIPLAARIFAVVDIWDALLFDRVYRKAWPRERVLEYLKNTAGIELDPAIVENFLEMLEET